MFHVSENHAFSYTTPLIAVGYRELLFDEIPILYVGKNATDLYVIGLLVNDYPDAGFDRYYHVIVNDDEYSDYFSRKVTVRDLINQASPLYIVDKYYNSERPRIYHYLPSDIPDLYKPSEQSFVPDRKVV